MRDKNKTKDQLINEVAKLRQRISELEESKTKQKQAEKALRESEARYREMIEKAGIAILIDDEEGNIKYANKKAAELYGYSLEEMNDQSVKSLVHPDDFERVMKFHKARIQGKRIPSSYVFKSVRKDGAVRYFELIAAPDKKEESIIGTRLFLKDVTKQKMAEEALRNSEERFRQFFENAPDYCYMISPEGRILNINTSALAVLGYKKEDVIGKPLLKTIYAPSSVEKARKLFMKWKKTGKLRNEELNIITKADEERTVLLNVDAVISEDGKVLHSISVQTDITERKRAEEQMKASLKEKKVLLQEIHHRVKNNMQIISSILNLQSGVIKNKRALELFKSSQSRIKSMALIHEKLYKSKDFTRIDFSKYVQSLSNDLFRVYGINQDVVKLNIDIKDVLLNINTAIPCGLIINELISNSLKHAFPDGRKGKIKIAMSSLNNNEMELTVSDNGIGIPEEVDIRGTKSLGLHLITILAEDQLQGELKLDKTKGTKFHMILRMKK